MGCSIRGSLGGSCVVWNLYQDLVPAAGQVLVLSGEVTRILGLETRPALDRIDAAAQPVGRLLHRYPGHAHPLARIPCTVDQCTPSNSRVQPGCTPPGMQGAD